MITMKDIAEAAGVSRYTVSIALSGKKNLHVSEEKRAEILRIADELGYCRNEIATATRSGKGKNILFVGNIAYNPATSEFISGASTYLVKNGYNLIIQPLPLEEEPEAGALHLARRCKMILSEGIIIHNLVCPGQLECLQKEIKNLPMIFLNEYMLTPLIPTFMVDHEKMTELAVSMFRKQKRTRPACIHLDGTITRRYAQYFTSALKKYGFPSGEKYTYEHPFQSEKTEFEILGEWLADYRPDCLFLPYHPLLGPVNHLCEKKGLSPVPVTLYLGRSDEYFGSNVTDVFFCPHYDLGWQAAEHLLAFILDGTPIPPLTKMVPQVWKNEGIYMQSHYMPRLSKMKTCNGARKKK